MVQDPAADEWFSERLGTPAALVRVTPEHERPGWGVHPGQTGFGDAHALELTSLSSLDGLNERIVETGGDAIPMNRFRPNIVISGWPEPHTEDQVLRASVGSLEFGYAARAIRCAVPTVNQATGEKARTRADPHPRVVPAAAGLRRRRQLRHQAGVLTPGTVHVGDEILVHEWLPEGPDPAPSTR